MSETPVCECGGDMEWEECSDCGGDGVHDDDCFDDVCCCWPPDHGMVRCGWCDGKGGWFQCPACIREKFASASR